MSIESREEIRRWRFEVNEVDLFVEIEKGSRGLERGLRESGVLEIKGRNIFLDLSCLGFFVD